MRKSLRKSAKFFLIVSVLLHLAVWLSMQLTFTDKNTQSSDKAIEIQIITNSTKDQLQVVEQSEKQFNDEVPEKAKYLSRHNQSVVKETRAMLNGDFKNSAGTGETKTPAQKPEERQAKKQKTQTGTLPTLSALSPKFQPSPHYDETNNSGTEGPASATNDHLKNVPVSIETMLNSREFVYYTYYQRIRQQIRQYWEPSIRGKIQKIFASGRSIASTQDHITKVVIILDRTGSLMNVKVLDGSGLHDLDDAAVEAFRSAEPFPNPPKGIIEDDGTIKIRWDFVLEAA